MTSNMDGPYEVCVNSTQTSLSKSENVLDIAIVFPYIPSIFGLVQGMVPFTPLKDLENAVHVTKNAKLLLLFLNSTPLHYKYLSFRIYRITLRIVSDP